MSRQVFAIAVLFCSLLASCSVPAPTWRMRAAQLVDELDRQGAPQMLPHEYQNLLETFEHGEAVHFVQKNDLKADEFYLLSFQKGSILRGDLQRLKESLLAAERKRIAEEAARIEEERLMREAAEAVERQRLLEQRKAAEEALEAKSSTPAREVLPPQPANYTVRRGETLPQIAARSEIYNDSSLWPLIYRSNRDQIRDPKQLWPGQILRIPRHFSRDEALEAKRYSGHK
ncbi:MAG: LysM peptidoglycan-binding domain-containing protein [Desulfuromonadales bacterium]|nr:LysM peptidoglycan-binding domain-containing protein [Desulfuromonadales bacterium]